MRIMKARGDALWEEIVSKLRKAEFSIIIDEVTDVNTMKYLAVSVTYYDSDKIKISWGGHAR